MIKAFLADQLDESVFGEVAGSQPTARTFIVLSRGAAPKTRNVKSERGKTSSKVLEVCQRISAISVHHSPDIWEQTKSQISYVFFGNLTDLPRCESQDKGNFKVIYTNIKRFFSHNSKFLPYLILLSQQQGPV